ncbi:hypothetical protein MNV49_002039 [Pseudohyphozyma bogoriensis]|nr:hypothetical protein MNV49_002039 [Pseudohyphozyma bogoriensis]
MSYPPNPYGVAPLAPYQTPYSDVSSGEDAPQQALARTPTSSSSRPPSYYRGTNSPAPPYHPPSNPYDAAGSHYASSFAGAALTCVGSTLLILLYVTGPPQSQDWQAASTALLIILIATGSLAVFPSVLACILIIVGGAPKPLVPPPWAKTLRRCAFVSLVLAMLHAVTGWNRVWVILLAVGLVFFVHIASGFPVYRYARGSANGQQLKVGFFSAGKGNPQTSGPVEVRMFDCFCIVEVNGIQRPEAGGRVEQQRERGGWGLG